MSPTAPRTRYDIDRGELAALLGGEPTYRVDQVWTGLYHNHQRIEDVTTLPAALRERLSQQLPAALELTDRVEEDSGQTVKLLYTLAGGARIETVLMHYPDRTTVCVSSQAGCAMACGFCATGQAGFERHLTVGEIVEQVVEAQRIAGGRRVSNVVFMGMGEPLANYDRCVAAVRRLHGDLGLSARHLTVSTVGIVPGIVRLAAEGLPLNLAVSLHAANDDLRDELVPINRRYPLPDLIDACRLWFDRTRRRISFEWALIDGVNDQPGDARELADIARPLAAHVNLIPLNPTVDGLSGTPASGVRRFAGALRSAGVTTTIRDTRGRGIAAACGQLAAGRHQRVEVVPVRLRSRAV